MKMMIEWLFSLWTSYWDEGYYQYLLLLSVIYLLFRRRKAESTRQSLICVLSVLVLFFCPLTVKIIRACIGEDVFWRVLWLIPLVPVIALAATEFLSKRKTKLSRFVLTVILIGVIALSGKSMFQAGRYVLVQNYQKVPTEVVHICNLIREEAEKDGLSEVRVAADDHLASYIRVYDASILMPYGRWAKGAFNAYDRALYNEINSDPADYDKIGKLALSKDCHFLILPDTGQDPSDALSAYGYSEIGRVNTYTIFQQEPSAGQ